MDKQLDRTTKLSIYQQIRHVVYTRSIWAAHMLLYIHNIHVAVDKTHQSTALTLMSLGRVLSRVPLASSREIGPQPSLT